MAKETYLYRHFDKDGRLLYVGITSHVRTRTTQHKSASPWAKEIVKTTVQPFDRRIDAAIAELHAIDKEKPLHNVPPGSERERQCKLEDAIMLSVRIPNSLLIKLDAAGRKLKMARSDYVRMVLERS